MFPAQPSIWADSGAAAFARRFRALRADTQGAYRSANVPIGDYFVVAVRSNVPADWRDPKYLQKLAALATRVTIGVGEKKSVDVDTKEVR